MMAEFEKHDEISDMGLQDVQALIGRSTGGGDQ